MLRTVLGGIRCENVHPVVAPSSRSEGIRTPVGIGFFYYRAVETIRQSMKVDDAEEERSSWERLRIMLGSVVTSFTTQVVAISFGHHGPRHSCDSYSSALLENPRLASAFTNSVLSSNCISLAIVSSAEACSPAM
jgi:hypothetical protein